MNNCNFNDATKYAELYTRSNSPQDYANKINTTFKLSRGVELTTDGADTLFNCNMISNTCTRKFENIIIIMDVHAI